MHVYSPPMNPHACLSVLPLKEKSFLPPELWDESVFSLWIMKPSAWTPQTHDTGYIISLAGFSLYSGFSSFILCLF
jgi:hypothetical protein